MNSFPVFHVRKVAKFGNHCSFLCFSWFFIIIILNILRIMKPEVRVKRLSKLNRLKWFPSLRYPILSNRIMLNAFIVTSYTDPSTYKHTGNGVDDDDDDDAKVGVAYTIWKRRFAQSIAHEAKQWLCAHMWRRTSTICVPRERAFRNATVSMSAWAGMGCLWYIWVRGRVVLRKSKLQCTAKVDSFIDAQLCAYVIQSPTLSDALPKYGGKPQLATFHAFRRRRCSRLLRVSVCFDESIEVDGTYRWQTWERAVASVGRTVSTIHSADALTNMDRFTERFAFDVYEHRTTSSRDFPTIPCELLSLQDTSVLNKCCEKKHQRRVAVLATFA